MSEFEGKPRITPSQLLIETLEKFGDGRDEVQDVVIIWSAGDADVGYNSTNCAMYMKVGMLEIAREMMLRRLFDGDKPS